MKRLLEREQTEFRAVGSSINLFYYTLKVTESELLPCTTALDFVTEKRLQFLEHYFWSCFCVQKKNWFEENLLARLDAASL